MLAGGLRYDWPGTCTHLVVDDVEPTLGDVLTFTLFRVAGAAASVAVLLLWQADGVILCHLRPVSWFSTVVGCATGVFWD